MRKFNILLGALLLVAASSATASAASIGLVGDNSCLPAYNGVIFCDADFNPSTGTGTFQPFLRTNPGGNLDPSSGWNTAAGKNDWTQPNDADDSWTSALALSTLSIVTISGTQYYLFDIDINQQGQVGDDSSLLSLSHLQFYTCTTDSYTDLTAASGCAPKFNVFGGTITYTADAKPRPIVSDTTWVDFNYRLHSGSGSGDIRVFVPVTALAGSQYIALLDGWGTPGAYTDNDGFQEWRAVLCPAGQTCDGGGGGGGINAPEPTSLLLFGTALSAFAVRLRSRRKPNATSAA